jgi:hypothetical protein
MDAASRPFSPIAPPEEEALDVREVDKVLTELAGMAGRWALFRKFLFERLSDDADGSEPASPSSSASPEAKEEPKAPPPEFDAIEQSACKQLIERVLDTYYTPLEVWYTRSTIDKAQRLAAPDTSAAHAGSTAPDDVFYILKSVLARVLATGERAALQHTVARLKDVIDTGYAGAIRRKLDDVYRTAVPVGGARGERAERESRQAFVVRSQGLGCRDHTDLVRRRCSTTWTCPCSTSSGSSGMRRLRRPSRRTSSRARCPRCATRSARSSA